MSLFTDRFKEAMKLRGVTQAYLAKKTGIPKSAISQYLSGRFEPKKKRLNLLSQTLEVSPGWLKGYDSIPDESSHLILSESEKQLLWSYRFNPDIKAQIDSLLNNTTHDIFRAAKSQNGTLAPIRETMTDARLRCLDEAPETDEDL